MTTRALVISLGLVLVPGCSRTVAPGSSPAEAQAGAGALAVGAAAPEAQLVDATDRKVALGDRLHRRAQTVVVFYRGFW